MIGLIDFPLVPLRIIYVRRCTMPLRKKRMSMHEGLAFFEVVIFVVHENLNSGGVCGSDFLSNHIAFKMIHHDSFRGQSYP